MPEEAPHVRNKGLLIVAIVLAAIVVVIYNVHINKIRQLAEGKQVRLVKVTRAMTAGEKIEAKDLTVETIRKADAKALGSVITEEQMKFPIGRRVRQNVNQGEWLQWHHVTGQHVAGPSVEIDADKVAITLELDARTSPGPLCSPGDRVSILAMLQIGSRPPKYYRVVRSIRVMMTGTYVPASMARGGEVTAAERRGARTYRSMAVQVSPKLSTRLRNVLIHTRAPVMIEVLPPDAPILREVDGRINPEEPELIRLADGKVASG